MAARGAISRMTIRSITRPVLYMHGRRYCTRFISYVSPKIDNDALTTTCISVLSIDTILENSGSLKLCMIYIFIPQAREPTHSNTLLLHSTSQRHCTVYQLLNDNIYREAHLPQEGRQYIRFFDNTRDLIINSWQLRRTVH